MVTVRFYGSLRQFGIKFDLDCKNVSDVLKALTTQCDGLRQFLQRGLFKVRIGRQYLDNRYLEAGLYMPLKDGMSVHFTPVLKGAKNAGIFQTIVGAVMVVVGIFTSWAGGTALIVSGVGMMVGGVAQMLTKTPSPNSNGKEAEKKSSTSFSNLANMAAQGRMVPIAYGRIRTGSLIISQGIETQDVDTAKPDEKKVGFFKGRM